jgi:hypothetical protein
LECFVLSTLLRKLLLGLGALILDPLLASVLLDTEQEPEDH